MVLDGHTQFTPIPSTHAPSVLSESLRIRCPFELRANTVSCSPTMTAVGADISAQSPSPIPSHHLSRHLLATEGSGRLTLGVAISS